MAAGRFKRNTNSMYPKWNVIAKIKITKQYPNKTCGNFPKKWDRSGKVVEALPFDQYMVLIDGSQRLTKRNRKYLRKYTPPTTSMPYQPVNTASQHLVVSKLPPKEGSDGTVSRRSSRSDASILVTPHNDGYAHNIPHNDNYTHTTPTTHNGDEEHEATMPPRTTEGTSGKQSNAGAKLAVRRLQDFNTPGYREQAATPVRSRLRERL